MLALGRRSMAISGERIARIYPASA
jgi:hypothetical protein